MRQFCQESFRVLRGNEQLLDALCKSVWVFGDHQQSLPCIAGTGKEIPIPVLLIFTFFDAADLPELQEQTIINVTGHEADRDPGGGNNIRHRRTKKACVLIKNIESHYHDEQLPEAQPELALQQKGDQQSTCGQKGDIACSSLP